MKKNVLLFALFISYTKLPAQMVGTGKKSYYYQQYYTAERSFHDLLQKEPSNAEAWLCENFF